MPADLRADARVPFLHPVTVAASPGGRPVEARALAISPRGVGLTCAASFGTGQAVTITFRVKDPRRGVVEERVAGRVVNFRADVDANRVGVVFLEPPRAESRPAMTRAVGRL